MSGEQIDGKSQRILPSGWRWVKLGEVCEKPEYGYTASAEFNRVGPKLLRITDIQNGEVDWDKVPYCKHNREDSKCFLKSGDIVLARTGGTTGKSFMIKDVPSQVVFASYLIRVKTTTALTSDYLYLFLQSESYWKQVEANKRGGAQPNMNATLLSNITLPLPPVHEQERIAANIREITKEVERAQQACKAQLEAAKTLPQSYLRQVFESDEAKKWERRKLGEVCSQASNRDPRLSPDLPFLYIDISAIDSHSKRITNVHKILGKHAPSRARQVVKRNDVLIATTRPNLNAVALVPDELDNEVCSTGFCVLRPTNAIDAVFLFSFTQSDDFVKLVSGQVRGMLYPAVSDNYVRSVAIPVPPLPEQKRIAAKIGDMMKEMRHIQAACEAQVAAVKALPRVVLRKAFSGEL